MICFEPRLVCIAEDVLDTPDKGISKLISTISQHCSENNILLVQCFRRRKLARTYKRGQAMSCFTILKGPSAVNVEWKSLQPQLELFCSKHPLLTCYCLLSESLVLEEI